MVDAGPAIGRRRAFEKDKGFVLIAFGDAALKNIVFAPVFRDSFFDFRKVQFFGQRLVHDLVFHFLFSERCLYNVIDTIDISLKSGFSRAMVVSGQKLRSVMMEPARAR